MMANLLKFVIKQKISIALILVRIQCVEHILRSLFIVHTKYNQCVAIFRQKSSPSYFIHTSGKKCTKQIKFLKTLNSSQYNINKNHITIDRLLTDQMQTSLIPRIQSKNMRGS